MDALVVNAVTGRQERVREIGANVASIPVADIQKAQIRNTADVLTGRATGVNVQAASGGTGTSQRIRIRGANSLSLSNEPLVYVDGVLFSNQIFTLGAGGQASSRLNDINPNDIENIEILKGPAASAQYGTAAANGVILVTTRRGRAGAPKWNAYAETGQIETTTEYPTNIIAYQLNTPGAPLFLPSGAANFGQTATSARRACPNFLAATGGCRQDSVTSFNTLMDPRTTPFSTGNRQRYGASVSGGTAGVTYFVSGDYEDERGVISANQLQKANVRSNVQANVTDKLQLSANAGYVSSGLDINSNDNSVFSPLINGFIGRAVFNEDTTTAIFNRNYRLFSPQALREYIPREEIDRLTGGITATYRPLGWLALNANTGLDLTNRFYTQTLQPGRSVGISIAPGSLGIGQRYNYRSNNYLYSGNGSGVGTFDLTERLVSTTTLGASYNRTLFEVTTAEGFGIVEGTRDLGTASSQFTVDEQFNEVVTLGAFGQQQLAFDDRIFASVGARIDRNSAFGADFGSIVYPSASLSWVVSEESFFPQNTILGSLRLRAAYG
nr:TonB-dependent receptor plug domain-containing protein [Gemmatimonadota bacterium]